MVKTNGYPRNRWRQWQDYIVSIKGPLTTPIGGGIRSLNVSIRQRLDLYACVRPVRYFKGIETPLKRPEDTNMIIFRENTEDIYAGIEWESGSAEAEKSYSIFNRGNECDQHSLPRNLGHRSQAGIL